MGWLSCYGSPRTKEDPEEREAAPAGYTAVKNPATIKCGKVHHDSTKPLHKPQEPSKDAPTEVPADGHPPESPTIRNIHAQTFTFRELAAAAKNFRPDCLIGEGGFGPVYKGRLENGQAVAIKQLDRNGLQGNREFLVEVLMLSLLHHDNLVNLLGYCADGDQRLLVYEYMPLGSLEDHLHDLPLGKEPLDWPTRMKIAAGAAKGLEYLHDTANPPVIYRDLKSSNILLGEGFYPKLSDFGLAKLGPLGDKTHVSTRVMGTYGYCAPEYAMTGQLTVKSDVYSFGVVLLELITGRKAIDQTKSGAEQNLVAWARPLFKDRRKFSQMADPRLRGRFPVRGLFQALAVAAMCLHEQAAARPSIADVVTALNFLAAQSGQSPAKDVKPEDKEGKPSLLQQSTTATKGDDSMFRKREVVDTQSADDWGADESSVKATRQTAWRAPLEGKEREQAVAEAKMWGEAWRERRSLREDTAATGRT